MGTIADLLNTAMRDFQRYTGDGLPNEPAGRALPVGDPASGEHNPTKKQVRDAFVALANVADGLIDPAAEAVAAADQTALDRAATGADVIAAEAARDSAVLEALIAEDIADGLSKTSATDPVDDTDPPRYFRIFSSDVAESFIYYRHDAGAVATEMKRYPSEVAVTAPEQARGMVYDQPNLFSGAQQAFQDLSPWTSSQALAVEVINGRRCFKVRDGFAFSVFPRAKFTETGYISGSLVVEQLTNASGSSRLRVIQRDAGGTALVVSDAPFGGDDISSEQRFSVDGIALNANTVSVEFYVMSGVSGSAVWVRNLLWAQGESSYWRPAPNQISEPKWQRLPNRIDDPGFELGVAPNISVGNPELASITEPALVAMGAVNGFKMTGSASAQVLMLEPIPVGAIGKHVLMAAYAYSPDGAWSPSASNSVYQSAAGATVTTGLKHEYVDINANVRLYLSYGVIPATAAKFAIGKFDLQASGVTNRLLTGVGYWVSDGPIAKDDVLHDVFRSARDIETDDPDATVNRARVSGLTFDQPNLFTRDQLTFTDLTGWSISGTPTYEAEVVNGRRCLKVSNGTIYREFPRFHFEESQQISASLWIEKLEGALRTFSNFIIDQYDASGSLISAGRGIANMGVGTNSVPRQLKIAGLALHVDCETIRLSLVPGSSASCHVRDMLIAQGSNPEFRFPVSASGSGTSGLSGTITIGNADKICQLGDSYTEGVYSLKDKTPVARLGELSDWRVHGFGVSGFDNAELTNALLTGMSRYGTTFAEINPSHTLIVSRANDFFASRLSWRYWQADAERLIQTVQASGSKPIICGEHPKTIGATDVAQMRAFADAYGLPFVDVASEAHKFEYSTTQYLWEGTHPGTRTNSVLWKPILDYVNSMPRPRTGLRLFRPRVPFSAAPLADLRYDRLLDRAAIWKELTMGHRGLKLSASSKYDTVAATADKQTVGDQEYYDDEYMKLHRGAPVSFGQYALVEVILPAMGKDLSLVQLVTEATAGLTVYALNRKATPPFSLSRMRGFEGASGEGVVGDVYSVPDSVNFTVVGNYDGMVILNMGEGHTTPDATGTLTKVSGTGPATITYTGVRNAFDPVYYEEFDAPVGDWEEVSGGLLEGSLIARYMQDDKLSFLIEAESSFDLTSVSVEYEAGREKPELRPSALLPVKGSELLAETLVGETAELASWDITGSITGNLTATNSGSAPSGVTKVARIDDANYLSQDFDLPADRPQSGELEVTVWCRRWEPLFDPLTDISTSPITADTFDFAVLSIGFGLTTADLDQSALIEEPVGLGWIEVKTRIQVPSEYVDLSNGLSRRITIKGRDSKVIEVARVSVKMRD